jgi:hypothetical protein
VSVDLCRRNAWANARNTTKRTFWPAESLGNEANDWKTRGSPFGC